MIKCRRPIKHEQSIQKILVDDERQCNIINILAKRALHGRSIRNITNVCA
jgi:hypothetical protein